MRGGDKLRAALTTFSIDVDGRVALDVGAASGGFTKALLDGGARRVYAVDVGHGQLPGSLRQDDRVVVMERTNIADLDTERVPEPLDVVTLDLSYLSVASAVPQLGRLRFAGSASLVALINPPCSNCTYSRCRPTRDSPKPSTRPRTVSPLRDGRSSRSSLHPSADAEAPSSSCCTRHGGHVTALNDRDYDAVPDDDARPAELGRRARSAAVRAVYAGVEREWRNWQTRRT
jgi:hypothetical protein